MDAAQVLDRLASSPDIQAAAAAGRTALLEVPELRGQVAELGRGMAGLITDKATLQQLVTQLQAELAGLRPATLTLGLNLARETWTAAGVAAHRTMLGGRPLSNVRVFFSPGEAPVWTDPHLQLLTPADRPFVSTKTLTEATLRRFLDTMPAPWKVPGARYKIAHQHEGEADILKSADPAGGITAYLATYAMITRVLADHPNGVYFDPWKILLFYTQALDPRPGFKDSWKRFVGDQDIPVGMDCYFPPSRPDYMPAEQLFGKLLQIHEQTGLRIGVPEWGGVTKSPKRNDPDGSRRQVAIRDGIAFLRTTPIEYVTWWCGIGDAGDHHLEHNPSNVAAWVEGMALNPAT